VLVVHTDLGLDDCCAPKDGREKGIHHWHTSSRHHAHTMQHHAATILTPHGHNADTLTFAWMTAVPPKMAEKKEYIIVVSQRCYSVVAVLVHCCYSGVTVSAPWLG
jgi:hypothetical protein